MSTHEISGKISATISPAFSTALQGQKGEPLKVGIDGVTDKKLLSSIKGSASGMINVEMTAQSSRLSVGLTGRLNPGIIPDWEAHITDYNNPHKTTAEQVGAIKIRLSDYRELTYPELTEDLRRQSAIYVDSNLESKRVTLETLKELNTKTIITENLETIDLANLTVGDYIGTILEEE